MDGLQKPFMQAAIDAMDYVESHPGVDFRFRLQEVTETFPSHITLFSTLNSQAWGLLTLMRDSLQENSVRTKDGLCVSFNVLVDMAKDRNFVTEPGDMTLSIRSSKTIPILKPLALRRCG